MCKKRVGQGEGVVIQVTGYTGADSLGAALYGCHLVVIPAGVPRKPGMTRDDLFNINASKPPPFPFW
jgi:malate/lactate dehydrogenase